MVSEAAGRFGRIDIRINNAAGNFSCKAEDVSPNGWNSVINSVLNGSFYCARAVGRHMIAIGAGGSIVSIVATYAWTGSAGTVHSAAAKAGVMAMTQTLAVEWAQHKILVNAVAPGPIEPPGAAKQLWSSGEAEDKTTEMVPLKRGASLEEIADAVTRFVAPASGYITGDVDGRRRHVDGPRPVWVHVVMALFKLPRISEIDGGTAGWGFFLCAQKDLRPTKAGGSYLALILQDTSGEIAAKIFDGADQLDKQFNKGDFVKVSGRGNLYKNQLELVLENVRRVNPAKDAADGFREEDCIPSAPRPIDDMWQELVAHVAGVRRPELRALLERVLISTAPS